MATKRAKTKRKAAVAKTKNNGKGNVPAIVTTDLFSQDAGIGVQDLTTEDLAIPFLKVLVYEWFPVRTGLSTLSGSRVVRDQEHRSIFMLEALTFPRRKEAKTTRTMLSMETDDTLREPPNTMFLSSTRTA